MPNLRLLKKEGINHRKLMYTATARKITVIRMLKANLKVILRKLKSPRVNTRTATNNMILISQKSKWGIMKCFFILGKMLRMAFKVIF
jgi:hypothetical protein